jgi:hypothetical protein
VRPITWLQPAQRPQHQEQDNRPDQRHQDIAGNAAANRDPNDAKKSSSNKRTQDPNHNSAHQLNLDAAYQGIGHNPDQSAHDDPHDQLI